MRVSANNEQLQYISTLESALNGASAIPVAPPYVAAAPSLHSASVSSSALPVLASSGATPTFFSSPGARAVPVPHYSPSGVSGPKMGLDAKVFLIFIAVLILIALLVVIVGLAAKNRAVSAVPTRALDEDRKDSTERRTKIGTKSAPTVDVNSSKAHAKLTKSAQIVERERVSIPEVDFLNAEKQLSAKVEDSAAPRHNSPTIAPTIVDDIKYRQLFEQDDEQNKKLERALSK